MLRGKTAIITGAARGIGRQIALLFAREGCNIAITYIVSTEPAQEVCEQAVAMGVKAKAYLSDAADFEAAHGVVEQVVKDGCERRNANEESERGRGVCYYA